MNYLVHAFVTPPGDDLLLAGHVLGDYFKGKPHDEFPESLKKAIRLHREVDSFADRHPLHFNLRQTLKACGRYRSILADILLDHLLAADPQFFPDDLSYESFVRDVRASFHSLSAYVPEKRSEHFQYIRQFGWLESYRSRHRLKYLMEGFSRRIQKPYLRETFLESLLLAANTQQEKARKLILETQNFVKDLLFKLL